MIRCWGCQRPVEEHFRTCTHCGASVANASKTDAASALQPPPAVVAERTSAPRITKARIQFVLNPAPAAGPSGLPGGVQAEGPPKRFADHVRSLREALRDNAQATLAIAILLGCVIYSAAVGTPDAYQAGAFNAVSAPDAARYQLLVRTLIPSFDQLSWSGATIKVDEAWVAQVGMREQLLLSNEIVRTGQQRLYLKLTIAGAAQQVGLFAGDPLEPLKTLTVDRQGVPTVLHYVDLAAFDLRPQTIVIRDPANPKGGSAKLVVQ